MTQLSRHTLKCPKCSTSFSILYYASINTWMDPNLAKKFLQGEEYFYNCPNCNQSIRLVTTIIVNTLKGMFNISTDASLEERHNLYQKYGLLNGKGEFRNPQGDWIFHDFEKCSVLKDAKSQILFRDKILEDINNKIKLYKEKLDDSLPLTLEDEKEFLSLKKRWEKEKEFEESGLHPPGPKTSIRKSILFHLLWKDLLKLKSQLEKLK